MATMRIFYCLISKTEEDFDFVTIFDGSNYDSAVIKKLSGNLGSFGMSSSGNVIYLKFKSDTATNTNGFLVTFCYGKRQYKC